MHWLDLDVYSLGQIAEEAVQQALLHPPAHVLLERRLRRGPFGEFGRGDLRRLESGADQEMERPRRRALRRRRELHA